MTNSLTISARLVPVALLAGLAMACQTTEPAASKEEKPVSASTADDERTDGKADLELQITVEKLEGNIMVSLVDEAGWNGAEPVAGFNEPASASPVVIMVDGLEPGQYGVKVFHDLNGNGELDTNLMGIPSEPYAFSNNASGTFGPPDFSRAAFEVSGGTTVHKITLK